MRTAYTDFTCFESKRVHLGVCGSVAAYRVPDLVRWWTDIGMSASVTLTASARAFITPLTFEALGAAPVYGDMFASHSPFAHLEPGQIAHALIIAPATATTLARLALGLADEMLACQALAFEGPLVIAPAMNPRMWAHVATQEHIATLTRRGASIVMPEKGGTACGDEGQGRMADMRHIWLASLRAVSPQDMQGRRVMVTLGPTREQWDVARFWSNPSTGTMGAALAIAAWLRGAEVHAVCGPDCPWLPADIVRHDVSSAAQMFDAAHSLWHQTDIGIFTAAVADFAPEPLTMLGMEKFKKSTAPEGFTLRFTPTVDILHTLARQRTTEQVILAFAAESVYDMTALAKIAHAKRVTKGADMLAANPIGLPYAGFASATNTLVVVDREDREEHWSACTKADAAWRLCSWLTTL